MANLNIHINSCKDCPYVVWERANDTHITYDCLCGAKGNKVIANKVLGTSGIETFDIPKWCPYLVK